MLAAVQPLFFDPVLIAIKQRVFAGDVKADIEAALKRQATADSQTIAVAVNGSEITLSGTVHSWSERELAVHAAWAGAGAQNVVDMLSVVY